MKRITKPPEERRSELIDIALRQFLEQGYEKTSIRGIVAQSGGKVGMFYHYFKSKEEIFEAALERYNDLYFERVTALLEDHSQPLPQRLIPLFSMLSEMMGEYGTVLIQSLNPETQTVLMGRTLERLVPGVARIIEEAQENGYVRLPDLPMEMLARFITYGTSSVLYSAEGLPHAERVEQVKQLLNELFRLEPGVL